MGLVHLVHQISRFKFAFSALLLAASALYVQHTGILPTHSFFTVSSTLHCDLLPDVYTHAAIRATLESPKFVGVLDAPVELEPVKGQSSQFMIRATHAEQEVAEETVEQAEKLLALELRRLATSRLQPSVHYIQELSEAERQRSENISPLATTPPRPEETSPLSVQERQAVIRLRKETGELRDYLSGGRTPAWLFPRIDTQALKEIDQRIIAAEAELRNQEALWKPGHKGIRTQSKILANLKEDRLKIRRHLSRSLLQTLELDLRNLEEKNNELLQRRLDVERATPPELPPPIKKKEPGSARALLDQQSAKLSRETKRLEKLASLHRLSGPTAVERPAVGYWVAFGLWSSALLCLIAALFARKRRLEPGTYEAQAICDQNLRTAPGPKKKHQSKSDLEGYAHPKTLESIDGFYNKLSRALGRKPKRLLILGDDEGLARSSFTLRFAKSLGLSERKVKLVDFDLPEKELTKRLGDDTTPGVGDILSCGGFVEEFFASVPGTNIQFAAAGSLRVLKEPVCPDTLNQLLSHPSSGLTLIDASFSSPLHLLVGEIDAVLCLTETGTAWNHQEEQVLLALREAQLPIWGVTRGGAQLFPFI